MKVRSLMATLAITLMLGVQGYANPCACVDPCGATCERSRGDLFSGLKKLVSGVRSPLANNCDPCEPVTACNPCDEVACDPCDAVCDVPRIGLGGRLRSLLAAGSAQCSPCDSACFDACDPCDAAANCDPCGEADFCGPARFSLRNINPFKGLRLNLNRGCATDCDPCDSAANCNPCEATCDDYCGPRGHLLDLPRFNLSRLFNGLRIARCDAGCGPCDEVRPCDSACCH